MKTICCVYLMAMLSAGAEEAFERAPIAYSATQPKDSIQLLEQKLQVGETKFEGEDRVVVRQLLAQLGIPEASQMLVFSRTSFQNDIIRPRRPRALFFGDNAYVGWVPGGLAEVAVMDPLLGPVFYSFDPHPTQVQALRFVRDEDCLRCHGGTFIRDIPAILARSVFTDGRGQPVLSLGSELVDYTTPLEKRWGGWYVTGRHGALRHRGNQTISSEAQPTRAEREKGANLTSLEAFFDPSAYLTTTSDIVALMVFEHQLAVHNALTQANQHCRWMLYYQQALQRDSKEPVTEEPVYESARHAFENSVEHVLDALLFKDEAKFPTDGIEGGKAFAEAFAKGAVRMATGASLRELDLHRRLFRFRCSYLVYTPAFQNLHPILRRDVLTRLWRLLNNPETEPRYRYLDPEERTGIREILLTTLPDLPPCWQKRG